MKHGKFIEMIADELQEERKSVAILARNLREAGLLTRGARGVNAPHMSAMDASRIVLAMLTGEPLKYAVAAVNHYRVLKPKYFSGQEGCNIEEAFGFNSETTVEQVIEKLFIISGEEGALDKYNFELNGAFYRPMTSIKLYKKTRTLEFNFQKSHIHFASPLYEEGGGVGLRTTLSITGYEIANIAEAIRTKDGVID